MTLIDTDTSTGVDKLADDIVAKLSEIKDIKLQNIHIAPSLRTAEEPVSREITSVRITEKGEKKILKIDDVSNLA